MSDSQKDYVKLERAKSLATEAISTIALQCRRFKSQEPEDGTFLFRREVDIRFLILAMHQLYKVAELANEDSSNVNNIQSFIHAYDREYPNLRFVRNVIMHIDEYIVGKGKNPEYSKDKILVSSIKDTKFDWLGQTYDVDVVLKSSESFYLRVLEFIKSQSV